MIAEIRNPHFFGYRTVSRKDRARKGWSLPAQKHVLRAEFERLRIQYEQKGVALEYGGFYVDDEPAYRRSFAKRAEARKLFCALRDGDHVAFLRMDRAFRNLNDFVNCGRYWSDRNITMQFIDGRLNDEGEFGERMLEGITAFTTIESAFHSEHRKDIWAERRQQKENDPGLLDHPGSVRLGKQRIWNGKRHVELDDTRVRWIALLITLYREKAGLSWQKVEDAIERDLAIHEGRKPRPRVVFKGPAREWSKYRCRRCYDRRDEILNRDRSSVPNLHDPDGEMLAAAQE